MHWSPSGTFLASVVLFFAYVRRRVGDWLALAASVPILFLGAAHDDLMWPYEVSFTGAMAFGIGALLVLERRRRHADAIVCALLVCSFTFSELALPFVIGVAVAIALDRGPWRRAYVVVIPLLFYAAWYAGWGHTAISNTSLEQIASSPAYLMNGLASSVGGILGFSGSPFTDTTAIMWGRPILLAILVGAVVRLRASAPVSRWFLVTLLILVSFWLLTAANAGVFRPPTASRYQYAGAVLLLLAVADLASGVRLRLPGNVIALGIAGIAALGWHLHAAPVVRLPLERHGERPGRACGPGDRGRQGQSGPGPRPAELRRQLPQRGPRRALPLGREQVRLSRLR